MEANECCADCFWFEADADKETGQGSCRLRRVEILDGVWTVCRNFHPGDIGEPVETPEIDGPILVDAGAFPDHLKPVYDWDAYLEREKRTKSSPFSDCQGD